MCIRDRRYHSGAHGGGVPMPPSALSAENCLVSFGRWLLFKFRALTAVVANRHRAAVATEISAHTHAVPHTTATPRFITAEHTLEVFRCLPVPSAPRAAFWFCIGWELRRRFFFQAEDGIRDSVASRGLGDVYKRQEISQRSTLWRCSDASQCPQSRELRGVWSVSYTHLTLPTILLV